jgi:hypothetical protein
MYELYAAITWWAIICRAAWPYLTIIVSQGVALDMQVKSSAYLLNINTEIKETARIYAIIARC